MASDVAFASPNLGDIEFIETPHFTFPLRPGFESTRSSPVISTTSSQSSLGLPSQLRHGMQRKSASALPTFSFNSLDASGLVADSSEAQQSPAMLTPLRGHGHRRGASELVGVAAQSVSLPASPFNFTPTDMLSADTPVRQGHAHRRSGALSISELPRLPISPNTAPSVKASPPEESPRPRLRVGFSEDVQIIPRPLSSVSTESSGTITSVVGIMTEVLDLDQVVDNIEAALCPEHTMHEGRWLAKSATLDAQQCVDNTEKRASMPLPAELRQPTPCVYARRQSADMARPSLAPRARSAPGPVPTLATIDATLEGSNPDLEALFIADPFTVSDDVLGLDLPRLDLGQVTNFKPRFDDDNLSPSITIDLDDAVLPQLTSTIKSPPHTRRVRPLHSSRPAQLAFRGRAASAPSLARFEGASTSSPAPSSMADVFEEDEDEDDIKTPEVTTTIVELTSTDCESSGLRIERPTLLPWRDSVEIVAPEDDPRESPDGKATLQIDSRLGLNIPSSGDAFLMTPSTYAASTFSSPDVSRPFSSSDASHLATSASSMTDCKTIASSAADTVTDVLRPSVDGVPSLTSTRSSISRKLQRRSRHNRSTSVLHLTEGTQVKEEKRRKRSSIHSLTKLVLGSDEKDKNQVGIWAAESDEDAFSSAAIAKAVTPNKEHRLSKLLFWKHKRPLRAAVA